ncbi:MAG: putative toxin-antitoxin system toxin component, PIN family [Deltaproteobacteria bacterium]|nr:putative toxin-antitoxin system toxin component, PIN family [Deltaproteobacteria bacterium]MBN2670665.1 putative toxin-antitoxin system toxin component, PIN family [Deltaproteobacteria bacterium]
MRVTIDTNVLLEGLKRKGHCGQIVDLWAARKIEVCVSTALALEYEAVLKRHGGPNRTNQVEKVLQALLFRATFVPIIFSYRPASPDPGDDMVIDCVMNGRTVLITSNTKDFIGAAEQLGFELLTPKKFLAKYPKRYQEN